MRIPGLKLLAESDSVPWRTTTSPGVRWLLLGGGEGASASGPRDATVLIRMEPGHGYPPHRHVGIEEVLVLSGGYRDDLGEHCAGDYVRYPAGSVHAPVALGEAELPAGPENPPCLLYACARAGIEPLESRPANTAAPSAARKEPR